MMILLEAHMIKHYVKDRLLLDIDQLKPYKNNRIGLVGRNCSGKTTLLNILIGMITPANGTIIRHTECEILPQIHGLDATKNGGEVTQTYINEAFVKSPKILFVDESTTNLDTEHIEWLEKNFS